jgi:DNA-binding beta-propeller fold protein YncE
VLGTFAAGQPLGIAFDGANMWIANQGTGTVSKLRASDGTVLGTFTVGLEPYGVVFDGEDVWVSGAIAIFELRASDGFVAGAWPLTNATGLAFDGADIWVAGYSINKVVKL